MHRQKAQLRRREREVDDAPELVAKPLVPGGIDVVVELRRRREHRRQLTERRPDVVRREVSRQDGEPILLERARRIW
jgi:hypothetical protein